jgi:hypothetical protein
MPESETDTAAGVEAWDAEARQAWAAEDFTRSRQLFEKVLDVWRSGDHVEAHIFALIHVTQAMRFEEGYDPAAARPLLEEALMLAERADSADAVAAVQVNLATLALEQGNTTKRYRSPNNSCRNPWGLLS